MTGWGWREWVLMAVLAAGVALLVDLTGGDLPVWGAALTGLAIGFTIDIAKVLGRRQVSPVTIYVREELD